MMDQIFSGGDGLYVDVSIDLFEKDPTGLFCMRKRSWAPLWCFVQQHQTFILVLQMVTMSEATLYTTYWTILKVLHSGQCSLIDIRIWRTFHCPWEVPLAIPYLHNVNDEEFASLYTFLTCQNRVEKPPLETCLCYLREELNVIL